MVLLPSRRESRKRGYRGTRTQGYGRIGQHRKSGGRGGTGKAGLHKHKWSWVVKYNPDAYGKHGFLPSGRPKSLVRTLNVGELETVAKQARQGKGKIELNLAELGFDKVLGRGKLSLPMTVKAYSFAAGAKSKIAAAGGEAVVLEH